MNKIKNYFDVFTIISTNKNTFVRASDSVTNRLFTVFHRDIHETIKTIQNA